MPGCEAGELRPAEVPRRKPQKRRRRTPPGALPGAPLAAIPEMAVEAAAGAGAAGEEFAAEKARWYLPEGMIRHEGDAEPGNLRVLCARGDYMEPLVSDGDRLLVDVIRREPGTGLVVKRVEVLPNAEPPRLRLISANPTYEPYTCLAQDAHIVGKVLDPEADVKVAAIRGIYTQIHKDDDSIRPIAGEKTANHRRRPTRPYRHRRIRRNHPAGRCRETPLRYAGPVSGGSVTQTKWPPPNPAQFN